MRTVTVVVRVEGSAPDLRALGASLDAQTVSTEELDVVWALGPDDPVPDRLEAWLGLRPHHRLVRGGTQACLAAGEGTYALVVTPGDRLYADAVERLAAFAGSHALDAVLARTSVAGAAVPEVLLSDAVGLPELPSVDAGEPLLMVRRESAEVAPDGTLVAPAGATCGVLGSTSVLRRPAGVATAAPRPPLPALGAAWDGPDLVVEVGTEGFGGPLVGLLEHRDDARQHLLPVEAGDDTHPVARLRVTPLDVPGAHGPLAPGGWRLAVQGTGADGAALVRPVAWRACPPALVEATGLVPFALDGTFALDVGPLTHPLLVVEDPRAGAVVETPFGARMTVALDDLHTADARDLDVSMTLGTLTLPARVVVEDGRARLEAMATGVQGVKPIGVRIGPGAARPLGLSLDISGVGEMVLVKTPEPARPAPARPAAAPTPPSPPRRERPRKPPPRRGLLAAVRRRVPAGVEPLARRAARWEPARQVYRRLTR